jgi:hypothetical protein
MGKAKLSLVAAALVAAVAGPAQAQYETFSTPPPPSAEPVDAAELPEPYGPPPIPAEAEAAPVPGPGGSYCYFGPHPVDTRVAGGGPWDDANGPHVHFYPPFDTRLFVMRDRCYLFIGDPSDFGFPGPIYRYYGAHPIQDLHGGGWCFMVGGHTHGYQPWSPYFVVVGAWNHWQGPYDRHFWSYWPYYSHYYRSYYPRYYGGGRFARGRGARVAPRIDRVPPGHHHRGRGPGWHSSTGLAPDAWRGGSTPGNLVPATPPAPAQRQVAPPARGSWSSGGAGWKGGPPAPTRVPVPATGSTGWKGGGPNPGQIGATRGGWRN